jgi:hypothetical protein
MNWWDTSERDYSAQIYGPQGGIASLIPNTYQERLTQGLTDSTNMRDPWSVYGQQGVPQSQSFSPYGNPQTQTGLPSWLSQSSMPYGTLEGLNRAEKAGTVGKWAGTGLGMLFGMPGMGTMGQNIGNYMGNRYIGSHRFQHPASQVAMASQRAPGSSLDINSYLYGNSYQPQQSPGGQLYATNAVRDAYGQNLGSATGMGFQTAGMGVAGTRLGNWLQERHNRDMFGPNKIPVKTPVIEDADRS